MKRASRFGMVGAVLLGVSAGSGEALAQFGTGACCRPDGSCVITSAINCAGMLGNYQGNNTTCEQSECSGACCNLATGACTDTGGFNCSISGGSFHGLGTSCAANGGACNGACCRPDGSCSQTVALGCVTQLGEFHGLGSSCDEMDCGGSCCLLDGSCIDATENFCGVLGGIFGGTGSVCADAVCPLAKSFTYQGRLLDDGEPVDGLVDVIFSLWSDREGGTQLTQPLLFENLDVVDGLFTASINFGVDVFNGRSVWLNVEVRRPVGTGSFVALTPRHVVSATPYALQTRGIFVNDIGMVGVGTNKPQNKLHVEGGTDAQPGSGGFFQLGSTAALNVVADNDEIMARSNGAAAALRLNNSGGNVLISAEGTGNLGIGTNSPTMPLSLKINASNRFMSIRNGSDSERWNIGLEDNALKFYATNVVDPRLVLAENGNVGIGTQTPTQKLDVKGTTRTYVLEITGGSDIAEPFNVREGTGGECDAHAIEPGMVVAIDSARVGELRLSETAYDTTVAGIISGANGVNVGMTLRQDGTDADGKHPVALTGRVWCWCDADQGGAINAGDLLTTSFTPGHAMRATDSSRSTGAIIGKAMSSLNSGRGLVLVLVNLQ